MYLFVALGVILMIIGLMSNEEITIKLGKYKTKQVKFEPKNKTESHQNIILVGIILSAVIATTTVVIIKMSNGIIEAQGTGYKNNKTPQGKNENVEIDQRGDMSRFLADARKKALQEQKKDGDLVDGNLQYEGIQKVLQIDNNNFVINIDESGKLKERVEEITAGCNNDEWCEKNRFFNLVANIPYHTNTEDDVLKYNKKPIEVLNYQVGDCDEKSFLLVSLLLEKKYKAVIIFAKKHAFVAMNIKNNRNIDPHHTKLTIRGLDYYYADTTNQNSHIGTFNKIKLNDFIGVYDVNKKKLIPKRDIDFYQG